MPAEGAAALEEAQEGFTKWQARGFAAEMGYMSRPSEEFIELGRLFSPLGSLVVFAADYESGPAGPAKTGYGRVARYAWGKDYHRQLKKRIKALIGDVQSRLPGGVAIGYRCFSDAVPLLERALGAQAAIGFFGKNTMLIRPGVGSYFFIAELLWELGFDRGEQNTKLDTLPGKCGTCQRCIDDCPTGAIVAPGELDSSKCISYLTIEKKTAFSAVEAEAIGDWVFGCDICQEVCPFNHSSRPTPISEFEASSGVGPYLELSSLIAIRSKDAFVARFAGTALMRAGREALVRNACSVVGNTRCFEATTELVGAAKNDPSALVREQAAQTAQVLLPFSSGLDARRLERAIDQRRRSA